MGKNSDLNPSTNTCECRSGYIQYSSNPTQCVLYHPNCISYDETGCIECESGYLLTLSNTLKTCEACLENCAICHSLDSCSQREYRYFILDSDGSIECIETCPEGYFIFQNTECKKCVTNCKSCTSSSSCYECYTGYYLITQDNSTSCVKVCSSGYYTNYDKDICEPCNIEGCIACQVSSGEIICTLCMDQYALKYNICIICTEGQYADIDRCSSCSENCKICENSTKCKECYEGNELKEDRCITLPAMVLNFSLIDNHDGTFNIMFDKELAEELMKDHLGIEMDGDVIDDVEYDLVPAGDMKTYTIKIRNMDREARISVVLSRYLIAKDSSYLIKISDSITIENPNLDNNSNNDSDLDSSSDSNSVSQSDYLSQDSSAEDANSFGATASKAAVSGAVLFGITVPSGIWSFINTLQLMSLIPMMNIDIPIFLFGILSGLRGYSPIPNILEYIIDREGPKPYNRAVLMGYESSQFLLNCGEMITTLVFTIILLPVLILIRKILSINRSNSWLYRIIDRSVHDYKWNVFTRFFVESYIEIGIAAFIQIWIIAEESIYESANLIMNLILCFPVLVIIAIFPLLLLYFIYKTQNKAEDESFVHKWGTFFSEFDKSKGLSSYMYYIVFTLRRLLLILCFFAFKYRPITQAIFASLLGWMVISK